MFTKPLQCTHTQWGLSNNNGVTIIWEISMWQTNQKNKLPSLIAKCIEQFCNLQSENEPWTMHIFNIVVYGLTIFHYALKKMHSLKMNEVLKQCPTYINPCCLTIHATISNRQKIICMRVLHGSSSPWLFC
jgi:hypothetical protein